MSLLPYAASMKTTCRGHPFSPASSPQGPGQVALFPAPSCKSEGPSHALQQIFSHTSPARISCWPLPGKIMGPGDGLRLTNISTLGKGHLPKWWVPVPAWDEALCMGRGPHSSCRERPSHVKVSPCALLRQPRGAEERQGHGREG